MLRVVCVYFSDTEWKKNLKLPTKDTRQKTEVSWCIVLLVCDLSACAYNLL